MQKWRCQDCNSNQLYMHATQEHGWMLRCSNGHELYPHPETILRAEKFVWIRFKS